MLNLLDFGGFCQMARMGFIFKKVIAGYSKYIVSSFILLVFSLQFFKASANINYPIPKVDFRENTSHKLTFFVTSNRTWAGLGSDNNWQTSANWSVLPIANDSLTFSGSTRTTSNNNFTANTQFNALIFGVGASSFTITGNSIGLAGWIKNNSTNLQTINANIWYSSGTERRVDGVSSGNISITGIISGTGILTKDSSNKLTLSGTNSYSGGTVLTKGTIELGASNVLPSCLMTMEGGTLSTGATSGYSDTTGAILLKNDSYVNLGTGSHSLIFAASNSQNWTPGKMITISGWQGTYSTGVATAGRLFIGSTSSGLSYSQLSHIRFYDGTYYYKSRITSSGEIIPSSTRIVTWISSSSGNWSTASSWSTGIVPTSTDSVVINNGQIVTVDNDAVCASLLVGGNSNTSKLTISATKKLTVSGNTIIGGYGVATAAGLTTLSLMANSTLECGTFIFTNNIYPNTTQGSQNGYASGAIGPSSISLTNSSQILKTGLIVFGNASPAAITRCIWPFANNTATIQLSATSTLPSTYPLTKFSNLTLLSGTTTLSIADTIYGNIRIDSGATLNLDAYKFHLAAGSSGGGALTLAASSTLKVGGTNSIANGFNNFTSFSIDSTSTVEFSGTDQSIDKRSYGNLILSGSGTKTMPDTAILSIKGNFTTSGTVSTTANGSMRVSRIFTLGAGTTLNASSFSHTVGGNWSNSGTFTPGASTITFNGVTQTLSGSTNFNNLIINSSNSTSLTANASIAGDLTISGGTYNLGSYTSNRASAGGTLSVAANAGLKTGSNFPSNFSTVTLASGTTVEYSSTNDQTIYPIEYKNLTISGGSLKTLSSETSVAGVLALTSGYVICSSNKLILTKGATVSGGSESSFVDGEFRKVGDLETYAGFTFHVGDYIDASTKIYKKIKLSGLQNPYTTNGDGDYFTVQYNYFNGSSWVNQKDKRQHTITSDKKTNTKVKRLATTAYWEIERQGDIPQSNATIDVTYYWDANNPLLITASKIDSLSFGHFDYGNGNSSKWEDARETNPTVSERLLGGTIVAGSCQVTKISSFSPFSEASTTDVSSTAGSLPVQLINFTTRVTPDKKVVLNWATTFESVNKGFRIERQTIDLGNKFENIGFVNSKSQNGNSQTNLYYSFLDNSPKPSATNHYRLVQEDLEGKLSYSEVRMIRLGGQSISMVYPNPSSGVITISRSADGKKMNIQVIDLSGKVVKEMNNITSYYYNFNINQAGVYTIKMTYPDTGEQSIQRVVVQR